MTKIRKVSSLEEHVGYWLRLVSNDVTHSFSQRLESAGVTVTEWVLLRELLSLGETAPSTLAERLGLTRGAISKLVEKLVTKGLVDRLTEDVDRRFQRIALTKAGRALVPKLAALADENDAAFFGHLRAGQRKMLLELLQNVARRSEIAKPPLD